MARSGRCVTSAVSNLITLNRNLFFVWAGALVSVLGAAGCSRLHKAKHTYYSFPKEAQVGVPERAYTGIGQVKSRVDFPTIMDSEAAVDTEDDRLCKNYFNKAVIDLVHRAKEKGADAVIDVKSVVFLQDGRQETYPRAECADDGAEGQVLVQGAAVRWK